MPSNQQPKACGAKTPSAAPIPRVVVGVSASPAGIAALAVAVREACLRGAKLHLVRVWREAGWLDSMPAEQAADLRNRERADGLVLARAVESVAETAPAVRVLADFVPGDLYTTLQARTTGAELLVLGDGGNTDTDQLIGQWFLHHAACPVLLVAADGAIAQRALVAATDRRHGANTR